MTQRFEPHRGLIEVVAQVSGPAATIEARLYLDTGSLYTILRPDILGRAGYDLSKPRSQVRIATASKEEIAPLHLVQGFAAMGHANRNIAVLAVRLPAGLRIDGVLGINFLRGRRLTVDFRDGSVSLE